MQGRRGKTGCKLAINGIDHPIIGDEMEFIPYEQWIKDNLDLMEEVDCPECHGRGTHECSCGDLHDCQNCNATGKVEGQKARQTYMAECEKAMAFSRSTD